VGGRWLLEGVGEIWLDVDDLEGVFSVGLDGSDVDGMSFVVLDNQVVLGDLGGIDVLDSEDAGGVCAHLFSHLSAHLLDEVLDLRPRVVAEWNHLGLLSSGPDDLDLLVEYGFIDDGGGIGGFVVEEGELLVRLAVAVLENCHVLH